MRCYGMEIVIAAMENSMESPQRKRKLRAVQQSCFWVFVSREGDRHAEKYLRPHLRYGVIYNSQVTETTSVSAEK